MTAMCIFKLVKAVLELLHCTHNFCSDYHIIVLSSSNEQAYFKESELPVTIIDRDNSSSARLSLLTLTIIKNWLMWLTIKKPGLTLCL